MRLGFRHGLIVSGKMRDAQGMGRWETESELRADVEPAAVWSRAYADVEAWPRWNRELKRAHLDRPLSLGATARIVFRTGLRLRFRVIEFEDGRLFTDQARLPGARMGHRHLVEGSGSGGSRLVNTIYIEGPLTGLWRRILGPAAARALPGAQRAVVELSATQD
jgi:Polyketide cyclase / dehydrase and lipid transport